MAKQGANQADGIITPTTSVLHCPVVLHQWDKKGPKASSDATHHVHLFAGGAHAMSGQRNAQSRSLVHLICFLLLFLIKGRTEGTEGACSVSPFAVSFLLSLCSCCPYSLAIYFVNKQSACNEGFFFLITIMSDFSRKAKEK